MRISDWSSDVCSSDLQQDRTVAELADRVDVDLRPREPQRRQGDGERVRRRIPVEVRRLQLREVDLVTHRTRHDERLFRAEPEAALRRGDDRDIARGEGGEVIMFLKPLQASCGAGLVMIAALPVAAGGEEPPRG